MVSRLVTIYHSDQPADSSDNAAHEGVDANSDDKKEEPQPVETDGVATETTSTPEEAGVASSQDQDEPEQSDVNAEAEPKDTLADSAAEAEAEVEAPASEKSSPTPAENFPLARTSLAYFFSPTPHSPQTQPFPPPSHLSSSTPFSTCSLPVAPPPSPGSPCHSQYAAAADPVLYQAPSPPNPRHYLPQMYPGSHSQGQFPYHNNNNMSRWMPPTVETPGMVPGYLQHPQQGNIQRSVVPVLPFRPALPLNALGRPSATARPAYASRPVTVISTSNASAPLPVHDSPVLVPMSSTPPSPSANSTSAPVKLKKNEYKGPLIVSSYPVRPPSQSQPAQQPQQSVQQPVQQQRPSVPHPPAVPVTANSHLFMNNPGHGYNSHDDNISRNSHSTNDNNISNVVASYRPAPFPQMPMSRPSTISRPGNGFPSFNGHHGLDNNTLATSHFSRSFPIEDPFESGTGPRQAPVSAVLKISNIPYNLLTREVMHFLGRRAKLLPDSRGSSIHIIMERSTAKTMDCYVELLTQADAQEALSWVNRNLPAHSPRLGDRHVHVEMSSQDELLREMFPRAKCVLWKNGFPEVQPNTDRYSTGFQGFLTNEELFCMVHYAEAPKRAPFAEKCPQRPYEFMISTLDKFPWSSRSLYTVEHRNVLFDATRRQLQALVTQVNARRVVQLDARLLRDLLNAGLRCPTFNERQKYLLRVAAGQEQGGTPRTAMFWPFDALSRRANAREESVEEYAQLIRAAVLRRVPNLGELTNSWDAIQHGNSPFGPLMLEWRGEGARRSLQAAINTEIRVMRALVSEGLAAVNTAV